MAKKIKKQFKTVFLASLGGGLEYYDFVIFAIFSKTIGENFFPADSSVATLIHSYLVFAVGYLVRPIGGIIFSHFGDKRGRKASFSFSISLMAVSTLLMSLLPNYQQWGLLATFLFISLRILQGFSIGGEIPGALTFISEHAKRRKGAACAVVLFFINSGILFGDLIYVLLNSLLSNDAFKFYGWRIAFFIGGLLALISFYIRRELEETQSFLSSKMRHKVPLYALVKNYKSNLIRVVFLAGASASVTSIFLLYFNAYAQSILNFSAQDASSLSLHQLLVFMLFSTISSFLTDKLGCRKILITFSIYLIFGPFVVFYLINHSINIETVILINASAIGMYSGAMPCYLSELFPVSIRYSGIALGYNLGFAVFGGLSPFISSLLIQTLKWNEAPCLIIALSGILALSSFRRQSR